MILKKSSVPPKQCQNILGSALKYFLSLDRAPKALRLVRAGVSYAQPSFHICVLDIFWLISSCVYVFFVSLYGPSKRTLRCYTSICDGIILMLLRDGKSGNKDILCFRTTDKPPPVHYVWIQNRPRFNSSQTKLLAHHSKWNKKGILDECEAHEEVKKYLGWKSTDN